MKKSVLVRKARSLKAKLSSLFSGASWRGIERCDVLLWCHDANRPIKVDGKAYSPLLNSFAESLEREGLKCSSIAVPYCNLLGEKATGYPRNISRGYILSDLLRMIGLKNWSYQSFESLMRKVYKRSKCKVVLGISLRKEVCSAAEAEGVFSVELMHGIGYSEAPSYYIDSDVSRLPDAFLALDDVSAEAIRRVSHQKQEVFRIKHPWFEKIEREPEIAKPATLDGLKSKFKKSILVTLQWGYDGEIQQLNGIIPNGLILDQVIEAIEQTPETMWIIRLHPVQYRGERYAKQRAVMKQLEEKYENCYCFEFQDQPLTSVLQSCEGHLTMYSMTCYEAAWLGVPSLVLCETVRKGEKAGYYEDLVGSEYVTKMEATTDSIVSWVKHVERKPRYEPSLTSGGDAVSLIVQKCQ